MAAEVGTAVVSEAASKVAEEWFDFIKREVSYVFKYQSYIGVLKNQVEELKGKRQMVEEPVNQAKRQGDEIYKSVENWLNNVDAFTENVAKPITGSEDEAKKRCFKGLCPNLFKRYSLSKKAVKAEKQGADLLGKGNFNNVSYRPAGDLKRQVEDLKFLKQRVEKDIELAERQGEEIHEDVKFWLNRVKGFNDKAVNAAEEIGNLLRNGNFTNVSYRPALEKTELVRVRGYQQFDSRLKVFQDVMEVLNDSNIDMIGVYGMGGVGKTTLVKQVARKVIEDKLFDEVAMAEVTQTPDHKKIQDKIARDLGLEFGQQESMFERADRLRARLKKEKRVLIILDNIWTKFEFDEVGIPFRDDENQRKNNQRRCTIILTSRSRDLLCKDLKSQNNFPIEVLSNEEAEQLFEKIVGDSAKDSDFQSIGHEIVGKCGGLPVALNTIANALKNEDLPVWKDALNQLKYSNPSNIRGMETDVYAIIKWSYQFLKNKEAKYLFLLCSLLRTGDSINIFDLLRYGMGLRLFRNVYTLETARNRVDVLIASLKDSCLLLDGDAEDEIKMHDIICAVAVSIAEEEEHMFIIQNISDLTEERINKNSTAISVPYNIQELPDERLEFPQLKFLLLRAEYDSSLQIPDFLFEGMKQLKVLNLTRFQLPSSLGCLINLQTLCLESCELQDIAMVGQLKKLEIFSLRDSNIELLPTEIGQLRHLQLLDLTNCERLEVIPPNVISKLSRLEELYMGNSFTKWEKEEGGGNASLVELKGLSKLTTLDIHIPSAEIMPQDLVSVELERFWIYVGNELGWYNKYKTSRFMTLVGLGKITLLGMKMLVKRTEDLFLKEFKDLQNIVDELDNKEGFPLLKHLHIETCYEISHIISLVRQIPYKVFPLLESLSLHNLINLEKLCQGQLTDNQSFSNLMIINVTKCDRLKHIFSFSMAKNLLRLQKIEVGDCSNLEMIVGPDMEKSTTTLGYKKVITEDDSQVKVIFPCLEELRLFSLTSIFKYRNLQYQNLKKVTLVDCKCLKYMFSYSMVNSLVQLEHLHIDSCESMEAVVVDTISTGLGGRDEGKLIEMVFPKLNYLGLRRLPKLTSFAIGMTIHSVQFPSLAKLEINICPNLIRFVSMSSLDDNILTEMQPHHFFDEKVIFPSLEELELDSLTSMENIWHNQFQNQNLKKITLRNCKGLKYMFSYSMVNSFEQLEHLDIQSCKSMEAVVVDTISTGLGGRDEGKLIKIIFPKLNYLRLGELPKLTSFALDDNILTETQPHHFFNEKIAVGDCSNLEMIVGSDIEKSTTTLGYKKFISNDDSQVKVIFPSLEELKLDSLTFIENICHNLQFQYQNLKKITLWNCKGLKYMISYSMVNSLVQLEHLRIDECESMEAVVVDTISTGLGGRDEGKLIEMVFPKLNYLRLKGLPKLISFAMDMTIHSVEFPSLSDIVIIDCPNLIRFISMSSLDDNILTEMQSRHFFDEKVRLPNLGELALWSMKNLRQIWHHQLASDSLRKLKMLDIRYCEELISIFPPMVALPNLMTLDVSHCEKLEEIIQQELGEEVKDDRIVFSQLKYLDLSYLTSLQSFCLGNYTLEFPSMERVSMSHCPNMKIFSEGVLLTPKLHKVDCWEGNLNSTVQKMFKEMVGFRDIRVLRLSLYPHLKKIWHSQELPVSFFNELIFLEVDGCMDMSSAIPINLLRCLNNLHRLTVSNCNSLEVLFHMEELNVDGHFRPLLPNLEVLNLINLPKLQRFCNFTGNIIALPLLTRMKIENCPKMEAFVSNSTSVHMTANKEHQEMTLEENFLIDDIQPFFNENVAIPCLEKLELSTMPKLFYLHKERLECSNLAQSWVSFQNLTTLEVSGSEGLMTLSTAESVVKLTIREMTQQVGEEVKTDIGLVFVHLKYLKFHHLPSLAIFCVGNYILEFPSLLKVIFS